MQELIKWSFEIIKKVTTDATARDPLNLDKS